ncbi:hypothetical protein RR48_14026 [Papilio machaon]|uniref:MADF domain-containing protein n=1 Tax=Papilio machaon TaxID=76193 RepID=A0A194QL74_PAPMA|nr:hypothetical protein RR48_14026 [Papilio machaon]
MSEQLLNIDFVSEVQKYPCLYNYTLKEYSKKDITEKAWEAVGKVVNLTVARRSLEGTASLWLKKTWAELKQAVSKEFPVTRNPPNRRYIWKQHVTITIEPRRSSRLAKKRDPSLQIEENIELPVVRTRRRLKKQVVADNNMAQYNFDQNVVEATFKGTQFYEMHANDLYLTDILTVEGILCQGKKIRQQLKVLQPGQTLTIGNAQIRQGQPLVIKRGGTNIAIHDDEYTLNRLTGMCAAFAAQQGSSFSPRCAMAIALGLDVGRDRILYYSKM